MKLRNCIAGLLSVGPFLALGESGAPVKAFWSGESDLAAVTNVMAIDCRKVFSGGQSGRQPRIAGPHVLGHWLGA